MSDAPAWPPGEIHPSVRHETIAFRRLRSAQDRASDAITAFAGSLPFVYIHAVWFTVWVLVNSGVLGHAVIFDAYPFGLLTLIVSLEAIFLSTFVMISQNREAVRADIRAELDFETNVRAEIWTRAIAAQVGVDHALVEGQVTQAVTEAKRELAQARDAG